MEILSFIDVAYEFGLYCMGYHRHKNRSMAVQQSISIGAIHWRTTPWGIFVLCCGSLRLLVHLRMLKSLFPKDQQTEMAQCLFCHRHRSLLGCADHRTRPCIHLEYIRIIGHHVRYFTSHQVHPSPILFNGRMGCCIDPYGFCEWHTHRQPSLDLWQCRKFRHSHWHYSFGGFLLQPSLHDLDDQFVRMV